MNPIFSCGQKLDTSESCFGFLRSSNEIIDQPDKLNHRLSEEGYLYLPGFFDQDLIQNARASLCDRLATEGCLDPSHPTIEGIGLAGVTTNYRSELARANQAVERVVYGPEIISFYTKLFGEPVRHLDIISSRALSRGEGTKPHCDLVYMNRGTHQLLTCWIPYGNIPLEMGGVMLLEDSHKKSDRIRSYLEVDLDTYCENRPDQIDKVLIKGGWSHPGHLSKNPVSLREKLGGRWLTAPEWKMGDLITFGMTIVHGSLDNQTDGMRLSSDTRYQRASQPIDERWIGENPIAHSRAGKRGRIC